MSESIANLRDGIVHGDSTARSVTESALGAAEKLNVTLNAFLEIGRKEALNRAAQVDAKDQSDKAALPLAGIPIAVKDNICVRLAHPWTIPSALRRNGYHSIDFCGFGDYWQDQLRRICHGLLKRELRFWTGEESLGHRACAGRFLRRLSGGGRGGNSPGGPRL